MWNAREDMFENFFVAYLELRRTLRYVQRPRDESDNSSSLAIITNLEYESYVDLHQWQKETKEKHRCNTHTAVVANSYACGELVGEQERN